MDKKEVSPLTSFLPLIPVLLRNTVELWNGNSPPAYTFLPSKDLRAHKNEDHVAFFPWRNISPSHTDFLITRTPVIKHIQQSRTAHEGEPIHQSLSYSSSWEQHMRVKQDAQWCGWRQRQPQEYKRAHPVPCVSGEAGQTVMCRMVDCVWETYTFPLDT